MDPLSNASGEEARETLRQLEARLRAVVADMVKVLHADVPVHVTRSARRCFERSARADELSADALRALKEDTAATSARLADEVVSALRPFEAWLLDPREPIPSDTGELEGHPRVGAALGAVATGLGELLARHGIPGDEADQRYRIPAYFVAGQFMKSLVANFWQSLADYRELKAAIEEADQAEQRRARRVRWDEV